MQRDLKNKLLYHLAQIQVPGRSGDVVSQNIISDLVIQDGKIFFSVKIQGEPAEMFEKIRLKAQEILQKQAPDYQIISTLTAERARKSEVIKSKKTLSPPPPLPQIRHIIAIASGKGGVGKSTTALNLALALAKQGLKIGILDADIYGPSLPHLLGCTQKPLVDENKKLVPLRSHNLEVMSIGFLIEKKSAAIWRGPMVMGALRQMLHEVAWSELDVLVVDMPPGTGDAHITLVQQCHLSGAIIVSTPQELALIDAEKAITMFQKVNVPILGLVENMSWFIAPDTGQSYDLFGQGGVKKAASLYDVPFLGEVPFYLSLREASDQGMPLSLSQPESECVEIYVKMAQKLCQQLAISVVL